MGVLFRILILLYPGHFRRRHGDEILAFWTAQAREPRYRGRWGRLRLGVDLGRDAILRGGSLRWQAWTRGPGSPGSQRGQRGQRGNTSGREEGMMASVSTDLRHAIRALKGAPLFTAMAVVTLSLGIGSATAVYSVVENVVLRPLPYPDADRLVRVPNARGEGDLGAVSWPDFRDWREGAASFLALAGQTEADGTFAWDEGAEALTGARVSRDFFHVMGVAPALGRTFSAEEDRLDGSPAVILSHGLWTERFGADPDILGTSVPLDGSAVPVVGVMPAGFEAPGPGTRFWIPLQDDALLAAAGLATGGRSLSFIVVVGRVAEGLTTAEAQERLRTLARGIDEQVGRSPEQYADPTLLLLLEDLVGGVRATLLLLLAAAGLVLLVAGVNVAGLALGRGLARSREMAVRAALGAPRARLVRQLLTESALMSLVAGALGIAVAWGLQAQLVRVAPPGLPRLDTIHLGGSTILFAAGATLASGLLFGLLPSLRAAALPVAQGLVGGRGSSVGRHALRSQRLLVSVQVAVAVVLLTGAALLTASFTHLTAVELGFQAESVTLATVSPDEERYATAADVQAFYGELLDAVSALPGVTGVSTTYSPPLVGNNFRTSVRAEGTEEDTENRIWAGSVVVGRDYFETSGVPILRGRGFTPADRLGEPFVAVVSQTLAARLWPGEDPLGKSFYFTGGITGSLDSFERAYFPREPFTVVGVAGDVRRTALGREPEPEYYRPHAQLPWGFQYLVVRTAGPVTNLADDLRRTVWSVDATVPVRTVRTLSSHVDEAAAEYRFRMLLLGGFAALTALLAMVGLYAVMTLAVARRTREMGIRLALGAARETVVRGVLGSGMRLVAAGAAVGLAVAWFGSRVLASMLYGVEPTDPVTYVAVVAVTGAVAAMACYGPARRAGGVDPVRSLQEE